LLAEPWPNNHASDVPVASFSVSGKNAETGTMEGQGPSMPLANLFEGSAKSQRKKLAGITDWQ